MNYSHAYWGCGVQQLSMAAGQAKKKERVATPDSVHVAVQSCS
jgi:hypothetical protein